MLINRLPLVQQYLLKLNQALLSIRKNCDISILSTCQMASLNIILVGLIVTKSLNWAAFGRCSLQKEKPSALRWIFYYAKIPWDSLFRASTQVLIQHYGITHGTISIDDTDKKRVKKTSKIPNAHKIKDKATGGYFNGQELIFMVLVTDLVTIPIGFRFYVPDPALSAWRKEDKRLKKKGVIAKDRPNAPKPNDIEYPKKQDLGLSMLQEFRNNFPDIDVKGIVADALYGTDDFMEKASNSTKKGDKKTQTVSQIRSNQIVSSKHSTTSVQQYFSRQTGVEHTLKIRGDKPQKVTMLAARLYVKAHGRRRYVVALKYENETDYRYLVASDLSWRFIDIVQIYTLRWLVEVFIQDWKTHCGWNKLSKQQGVKGSERGLIVSLLCDHLLLLHPEQSIRLKNKQPGLPVGCIIERLNVESLLITVEAVVDSEDPNEALKALSEALKESLPTRNSSKHMAGRDLGRQESTESLKYHAKAA